VDELFHWPLAAAWLLLLAGVALTLAPTHRRLAVAT
jgi:hypothetical protein